MFTKIEILNTNHTKIYNCVGKLTVRYNVLIEFIVTYQDDTTLSGEVSKKVNYNPNKLHINEIEQRCKGIVLHYLNNNV